MREPNFSPVGAGLVPEETSAIQGANGGPPPPSALSPPSLYTPPRVAHVGDIVTVIIAMNDKATLGNASGRSQTTKDGVVIDYGFNNGSAASSRVVQGINGMLTETSELPSGTAASSTPAF